MDFLSLQGVAYGAGNATTKNAYLKESIGDSVPSGFLNTMQSPIRPLCSTLKKNPTIKHRSSKMGTPQNNS